MMLSESQIKKIIKAAMLRHFEQIPHSPGLFVDGYFYRAKHQDSLSMVISDAAAMISQPSLANFTGASTQDEG